MEEILSNDSKVLAPYRVLGVVCNEVPFCTKDIQNSNDTYVTTAVGNRIQTYSTHSLHLFSISDALPARVSAIASDERITYVGDESGEVSGFFRGTKRLHVYESNGAGKVLQILALGAHIVVLHSSSLIRVWEKDSEQLYTEIQVNDEEVLNFIHPHTYMNKILLGTRSGRLLLWNIKSNKKIFEFPGWDSPVTSLAAADVLDVVGIGLADGSVYVHNLKKNRTLRQFGQNWGEVTTLSFRSDNNVSHLITGSSAGQIAVWDLENDKLLAELESAHDAAVSKVECLKGEPVFVSSSSDNSLKMWIMDDLQVCVYFGFNFFHYHASRSGPESSAYAKASHNQLVAFDFTTKIMKTVSCWYPVPTPAFECFIPPRMDAISHSAGHDRI